jgi:hypothetical protein
VKSVRQPAVLSYAVGFLEESLGLSKGTLRPDDVPNEFVELLAAALRGAEASQSPEPELEKRSLRLLSEVESALLERDGFYLRKARWPGGAPYAACLTHDVDNVSRPRSHLIQVRSRFSPSDFLLAMMGLKSLYNNISYVAREEEHRNLRSSFYLLSSNYDLTRLRPTLTSLKDRGWEIGLHGDFGTHDSEEKMADAVSRFNSATGIVPRGLREHFLRFDYGASWAIMEKSGFSHDSSVGSRDTLGFRLGLCTPFHPPDNGWSPLRILELPLVLMDTTLWGYLKRSEEEGMRDIQVMKGKVAAVEGLFTVLWHQEAARMRGGRLYPRLLDDLVKDRCFVGSGESIAGWWNARARPLERSGSVYSMDSCPAGLCLRFKAKEETKLSVEGGSVDKRGMENETAEATIAVSAERFRLKVG